MNPDRREKIRNFFLRHRVLPVRCNPSPTRILIVILLLFLAWHFRYTRLDIKVFDSTHVRETEVAKNLAQDEQIKLNEKRLDEGNVALERVRERQNTVLKEIIDLQNKAYDERNEIERLKRKLDAIKWEISVKTPNGSTSSEKNLNESPRGNK